MPADVRRFLTRGVPFTALLLALFAGVYAYADGTARRFDDKARRFEALVERGSEVQALFVGNSLCCAADFDALGMPGFELRHPGSDLYEAAYVARRALPHLPNLRRVFLPMGYTALHWDNSLRDEMRAELYAIYRDHEPIGGSRAGLLDALLAPVVRPDNLEELVARLWREPALPADIDAWGRIDHEVFDAVLTPDRLEFQAEKAVERHLSIAANVDAHRPEAAGEVTRELVGLAEELDQHDVELVLLLPAFHATYNEQMSERERGRELVKELRETLRDLGRAHANVRFLDASTHPVLSKQARFFRACDHLSDRGAAAYSSYLRKALAQR